jgi:hypothetical protein
VGLAAMNRGSTHLTPIRRPIVHPLRLERHSREEISDVIDRAVRSVTHKLEIVRQAIETMFRDDD